MKLSYDWQLEDKYGRYFAYVWIDERLFNEFILEEGFASVFLKFPFREDYRERLMQVQKKARRMEIGLWKKDPSPSAKGEFSALLPQEAWHLFPEYKSFLWMNLVVAGFLEEYKDKRQIMIFFSRQLKKTE